MFTLNELLQGLGQMMVVIPILLVDAWSSAPKRGAAAERKKVLEHYKLTRLDVSQANSRPWCATKHHRDRDGYANLGVYMIDGHVSQESRCLFKTMTGENGDTISVGCPARDGENVSVIGNLLDCNGHRIIYVIDSVVDGQWENRVEEYKGADRFQKKTTFILSAISVMGLCIMYATENGGET